MGGSRMRAWTARRLPLMAINHAKSWPKNHIFHMKPNSWTCSTTIFEPPTRKQYISCIIFYFISRSTMHQKKLNTTKYQLFGSQTSCIFFELMFFLSLRWCWMNHIAAKSAPFKYLHEYNFLDHRQDSKGASSNCQWTKTCLNTKCAYMFDMQQNFSFLGFL